MTEVSPVTAGPATGTYVAVLSPFDPSEHQLTVSADAQVELRPLEEVCATTPAAIPPTTVP